MKFIYRPGLKSNLILIGYVPKFIASRWLISIWLIEVLIPHYISKPIPRPISPPVAAFFRLYPAKFQINFEFTKIWLKASIQKWQGLRSDEKLPILGYTGPRGEFMLTIHHGQLWLYVLTGRLRIGISKGKIKLLHTVKAIFRLDTSCPSKTTFTRALSSASGCDANKSWNRVLTNSLKSYIPNNFILCLYSVWNSSFEPKTGVYIRASC